MAGTGQNSTPPHRRRRRAARRAAGPPTVADRADQQPTASPSAGGPADERAADAVRGAADAVPGAAHSATAAEGFATAGGAGAVAGGAAADEVGAAGIVSAAFPAGADALVTERDSGPPPVSPPEVHGSPGHAPGHGPGQPHPGGPPTGGSRDRDHGPAPASAGEPSRRTRSSREEAAERSLRSLVTTRSTQVSPTTALRAREVALPSAADLAAAEAELVIVRRHYVPPTVLTAGRRPERPARRDAGGKTK